ncbi:MAG: hypothetical protein JWN34_1672 [Bryobacterales bacterium]|nr:hypothetical protein [Bryobacterales bacterium]
MLALSGAILGFFVSLLVPHRYVATATLRFLPGAHVPRDLADTVSSRLFASETLAGLVSRETNLRELLDVYRNDEVFDIVRAGSHVTATSLPGGAQGLRITYEDDDAERALGVDRELTITVAKMTAENGGEITELIGTPHTQPSHATAALTTGIGLAIGVIAGLLSWAAVSRMP